MRVATFFLISILVLANPVSAEPSLEIGLEEYNFGQVVAGTVLDHSFWMKSTGTDTVQIAEIKTGCDCAMVDMNIDVLAPGDSVRARFVWETERKYRLQRRVVRIFTDASRDPYRLMYTAMVMQSGDSARPVTVLPYRFTFSEVAGISRDSIGFVMKNHSELDYAIYTVSEASENWTVSVPDSLPAGGQVSGFVKLTGDGDKPFEDIVTFQFDTSGKDPRRFTVPVERKRYGM